MTITVFKKSYTNSKGPQVRFYATIKDKNYSITFPADKKASVLKLWNKDMPCTNFEVNKADAIYFQEGQYDRLHLKAWKLSDKKSQEALRQEHEAWVAAAKEKQEMILDEVFD